MNSYSATTSGSVHRPHAQTTHIGYIVPVCGVCVCGWRAHETESTDRGKNVAKMHRPHGQTTSRHSDENGGRSARTRRRPTSRPRRAAAPQGKEGGNPATWRGSRYCRRVGALGLTDEASPIYRVTFLGRPFLVVITRNDTPSRKYPPKS